MKYRYCLLIFAAAIVLSGCSVKWEGIQAKGYKAFQGIPIGTHSLDLYELYTQDADHFELRGGAKNDGENTIICREESCTHMTEKCIAYYRYPVMMLAVDDRERLYLLDGGAGGEKKGTLQIFRIDPARQLKEKVAEFSLGEMSCTALQWRSFCLYNEMLYVSAQYLQTAENTTFGLLEANLKNGESQFFVPKVSEGQSVEFLGIDEDGIYWKSGTAEILKRAKKSSQIETVYQGRDSVHDLTLMDHWIIYNETRGNQTAIYVYDLNTEEEERICEAAETERVIPSSAEHVVVMISNDGGKYTQRFYHLDTGQFTPDLE